MVSALVQLATICSTFQKPKIAPSSPPIMNPEEGIHKSLKAICLQVLQTAQPQPSRWDRVVQTLFKKRNVAPIQEPLENQDFHAIFQRAVSEILPSNEKPHFRKKVQNTNHLSLLNRAIGIEQELRKEGVNDSCDSIVATNLTASIQHIESLQDFKSVVQDIKELVFFDGKMEILPSLQEKLDELFDENVITILQKEELEKLFLDLSQKILDQFLSRKKEFISKALDQNLQRVVDTSIVEVCQVFEKKWQRSIRFSSERVLRSLLIMKEGSEQNLSKIKDEITQYTKTHQDERDSDILDVLLRSFSPIYSRLPGSFHEWIRNREKPENSSVQGNIVLYVAETFEKRYHNKAIVYLSKEKIATTLQAISFLRKLIDPILQDPIVHQNTSLYTALQEKLSALTRIENILFQSAKTSKAFFSLAKFYAHNAFHATCKKIQELALPFFESLAIQGIVAFSRNTPLSLNTLVIPVAGSFAAVLVSHAVEKLVDKLPLKTGKKAIKYIGSFATKVASALAVDYFTNPKEMPLKKTTQEKPTKKPIIKVEEKTCTSIQKILEKPSLQEAERALAEELFVSGDATSSRDAYEMAKKILQEHLIQHTNIVDQVNSLGKEAALKRVEEDPSKFQALIETSSLGKNPSVNEALKEILHGSLGKKAPEVERQVATFLEERRHVSPEDAALKAHDLVWKSIEQSPEFKTFQALNGNSDAVIAFTDKPLSQHLPYVQKGSLQNPSSHVEVESLKCMSYPETIKTVLEKSSYSQGTTLFAQYLEETHQSPNASASRLDAEKTLQDHINVMPYAPMYRTHYGDKGFQTLLKTDKLVPSQLGKPQHIAKEPKGKILDPLPHVQQELFPDLPKKGTSAIQKISNLFRGK